QIKNEKLQVILGKIEKRSGYAFVYSNDEIDAEQKLSLQAKEKELADVLSELLTPLHIGYEIIKNKIILKGEKASIPLAAGSSGLSNNLSFEAVTAPVKRDTSIEGRVVDENKNPLPNINVQLKGTSLGTITNPRGQFSLHLPDDQKNGVLVFSSIGFV